MNGSLLLDITQIPNQLGGLAGIMTGIALALFVLLVPLKFGNGIGNSGRSNK